MEVSPFEYLEHIHSATMILVGSDDFIKSGIDGNERVYLDEILDKSESSKGVLTVLLTSLVYKIFHPEKIFVSTKVVLREAILDVPLIQNILRPF